MLLSMLTKFWSVGILHLKRVAIKGLLCLLRAKKKGRSPADLHSYKLSEKIFSMLL